MDKQLENSLDIGNEDIDFIKSYLKGKSQPLEFADIVYQVALFKTQDNRKSRVKVYDPDCEYSPGDLIYKEYPGQLPIGNKKYTSVEQGIILKVEDVRNRQGRDEIRLSYDGTSEFRKYAEYLKKQKIELLLPHKGQKTCKESEYLTVDHDPRRTQSPLIERDFAILRKKLTTVLNKENSIAFISDKMMLKENLKELAPEVFSAVKEFLKTRQTSESTEFFVENFVKVAPADPAFAATCFALNYIMTTQYKIDLQQTSARGWGKWHLLSVLYHIKKNALIGETNPFLNRLSFENKKNLLQRRKKLEESIFSEGETRYFLTQREIASGAVRLKSGLYRFGSDIEIEALDTFTHKKHTLYYYQDENLLLGFERIFETYKALQGATLVFEQTAAEEFQFTIKTTKKGLITDKIVYDAEKKIFQVSPDKMASQVCVNKSIFLEAEVFHILAERMEEFRKIETYNKLFHKIFLEFGGREKNYEIHLLRLYHILDLIAPVDLKLVEEVILSNPEFVPAEKLAGVFYLDKDAVMEIEEEERDRRQGLIEEMKRKREVSRKHQLDEELKVKEEIRLIREERRKKREEEMWQKEKLLHEKESRRRQESTFSTSEKQPGADVEGRVRMGPKKPYSREDEAVAKASIPLEASLAKPESGKKLKKKIDVEKMVKTVRKGQKKILEEKIELDEIKKQIMQADISEIDSENEAPVEKKKPVKGEEVRYQDEGGFGGILASQLDEIVKKDTKKDTANEKKGKRKAEKK
ncbi:MAG: hypothetical protein NTZ12_01990 [Candidatus Aminicenantes bacterium]|nr:hypothetical protein [Candidatus Aminicenantes bacterium]